MQKVEKTPDQWYVHAVPIGGGGISAEKVFEKMHEALAEHGREGLLLVEVRPRKNIDRYEYRGGAWRNLW
jgi:hypothetical protein